MADQRSEIKKIEMMQRKLSSVRNRYLSDTNLEIDPEDKRHRPSPREYEMSYK